MDLILQIITHLCTLMIPTISSVLIHRKIVLWMCEASWCVACHCREDIKWIEDHTGWHACEACGLLVMGRDDISLGWRLVQILTFQGHGIKD
jgi:hypothetical protein